MANIGFRCPREPTRKCHEEVSQLHNRLLCSAGSDSHPPVHYLRDAAVSESSHEKNCATHEDEMHCGGLSGNGPLATDRSRRADESREVARRRQCDLKFSRHRFVRLSDYSEAVGEEKNLEAEHPEIVSRLTALLQKYVAESRSTPGARQTNDVKINLWRQPARASAGRSVQP